MMRLGLLFRLGLGLALVWGSVAYGQGCSQCRDSTAAAPVATQRAYRRAIVLMTLAGSGVFVGTVWIVRRQR
jgi:hypothetical protein